MPNATPFLLEAHTLLITCPRFIAHLIAAVVAKWLRRLTRNQFPSGSVGLNPTDCELLFLCFISVMCFLVSSVLIVCLSEVDIWSLKPNLLFDAYVVVLHRWFSGRMLACHAGGPGSIPGRCKNFALIWLGAL